MEELLCIEKLNNAGVGACVSTQPHRVLIIGMIPGISRGRGGVVTFSEVSIMYLASTFLALLSNATEV